MLQNLSTNPLFAPKALFRPLPLTSGGGFWNFLPAAAREIFDFPMTESSWIFKLAGFVAMGVSIIVIVLRPCRTTFARQTWHSDYGVAGNMHHSALTFPSSRSEGASEARYAPALKAICVSSALTFPSSRSEGASEARYAPSSCSRPSAPPCPAGTVLVMLHPLTCRNLAHWILSLCSYALAIYSDNPLFEYTQRRA